MQRYASTMTIEESIKLAMARMIERNSEGIENVEVKSWEEEFEKGWSSGCDTCGYGADDDSYKVFIYYTHSGIIKTTYYVHEGTFAELIKELDA